MMTLGHAPQALLLIALLACKDDGKPAPTTASASSSAAIAAVAPSKSATPMTSASASTSAVAVASADPTARAATAIPELMGADGKPLGQTNDKPSLRSKTYERRLALLWEAIVKDDATIAGPAFFPLVAYQQVKAIPNPTADWTDRLMKAFVRDIHWAHEQLGPGSASAEFVGLELVEDKARWMEPGSEGNKLGYWRALNSKLRWIDGGGSPKSLEVTSLISWRGEWFIVHVHGFK